MAWLSAYSKAKMTANPKEKETLPQKNIQRHNNVPNSNTFFFWIIILKVVWFGIFKLEFQPTIARGELLPEEANKHKHWVSMHTYPKFGIFTKTNTMH